MTLDDIVRLEQSVLDAARAEVEECGDALRRVGLRVRDCNVRVEVAKPTARTSELVVTFFDDDGLADILEFFVYDRGDAQLTVWEATVWLKEQIAELPARYTARKRRMRS